jgi:hypothetical protein
MVNSEIILIHATLGPLSFIWHLIQISQLDAANIDFIANFSAAMLGTIGWAAIGQFLWE